MFYVGAENFYYYGHNGLFPFSGVAIYNKVSFINLAFHNSVHKIYFTSYKSANLFFMLITENINIYLVILGTDKHHLCCGCSELKIRIIRLWLLIIWIFKI